MGSYKKIAGIYCITNLVNNKKYVGCSENIKKRWENHKFRLNSGISDHRILQSDWSLYGKDMFVFSILEVLSSGLSKEEYNKYETKWVLYFSSHLEEKGYNCTLPGSIYLKGEGENITAINRNCSPVTCINELTKEIKEASSTKEASIVTGIKQSKIWEYCSYWKGKSKGYRSRKGWIVVYKEDYDETFDYINYFHPKKEIVKKPKKVYTYKKNPEDIIPYKERKLKRCPIVAVNVLSGEEKIYPTIKECCKDFNRLKVFKCINSPFMKYKHRGYYFKRQ